MGASLRQVIEKVGIAEPEAAAILAILKEERILTPGASGRYLISDFGRGWLAKQTSAMDAPPPLPIQGSLENIDVSLANGNGGA